MIGLLILTTKVFAQDPNFYIYLCFGQSNMEGQGSIEEQDKTVDSRLKVMEAVNCSNLGRTKGSWYTATPPLCRCYSGLSPADYFGRTMVENLPDSIKVGIINVSVAGCKIELFDKDNYQDYVSTVTESWLINIINAYGGNPYGHLVDIAKLAQQDGVIKGILLHQGESNTGDTQWPSKVKGVYDSLINDLGLNPDSVPLLAGEVVNADQGGICASMNSIIATLPQTISNSYVISSSGCTDAADNLHFNSAGYRKLGTRYAVKMLSLLGYEIENPEDSDTTSVGTVSIYFEPECSTVGGNWDIINDDGASNESYVTVKFERRLKKESLTLTSNESYVTVKSGIESITEAPTGSESAIYIPFSVDTAGSFSVFARLNCPSYDDDSYWVKMDDGEFSMCNGLYTSGWQWLTLDKYELTAGEHTLTITYREDGAKLDKINISNYPNAPEGMGEEAENVCTPTAVENPAEIPDSYALGQNYPNPFNPTTKIEYFVPRNSHVSLKVYDVIGNEVATLFEGMRNAGNYVVSFDGGLLSSGIYFYQMKSENFMKTKKLVLLK
jgi:hypothetical protein